MSLTWTSALPRGTPLERPKINKRRRTSSPEPDEAATSCVSNTATLPNNTGFDDDDKSNTSDDKKDFEISKCYGSEPEDSSDEDDDGPVLAQRRYGTITDEPEPRADVQNEADTHSYRPRGIYDFQWTSFPDPPIQPELRRETFSNSSVGPTSTLSDPYEAFTAIWDHEIMERIANETNRYAQQTAQALMDQNKMAPDSSICKWRDTCVQEIYVFFGLVLAIGVVVQSNISDYWNKSDVIFSTPGFRAYMSLHRFQLLNQTLHFINNENFNPAKMDRAQARLFKIEPVITHLNNKFQSMYALSQNLVLDESLLRWNGWLNVSNKKAKTGIKSYEICEAKTGYVWRFEMLSQHKQTLEPELESVDPMSATIPSTVLRLVQGLENKGYTLWMDNYYNSPALARKLKSIGFDCAGTLHTNRQFVPEALKNLKSQMEEGQIIGLTSGDVDLMVWKNRTRVGMISTYHGNTFTEVDEPLVISDYNVIMEGVDKKERILSQYPIERKRSNVWYKKLFKRLLNVSVLNAYIIVKHNNSNCTHRDFRTELIRSILKKNSDKVPVLPTPRPNYFEAKTHYVMEYAFPPGKNQRLRRLCTLCKKRVATYCVGCEQTVCIQPCFATLHQ